jgi:phage major head subunit gpT-like protein
MPALTPQFLFDLESNMQVLTENEYARLSSNLWWSRLMKTKTTNRGRELLIWLLSTAQIEDLEEMGGKMVFTDLVSNYTEITSSFAGQGLKLFRPQIEDTDGNGVDFATKWSGDMGAYMAYWPQKLLVKAIKEGHQSDRLGYDGVPFFSNAHPLNPFNDAAGTYANLLTGAAASTPATDLMDALYPGACPIDDSVTVDVALVNLAKVTAYIESIRMPNGDDPRFLRPVAIVAPPRMKQRVVQLTNAKFIAQAATGGAATADVEKLITSMGFVEPIIASEFSGFEDNKTWFLACEELSSSQLGGFIYLNREPFSIRYYTGAGGGNGVDAQLDRMDELEWHCKGRNKVGYGHPYTFFKIKAT